MRSFIKRAVFFLSPFIAYVMIVTILDPFSVLHETTNKRLSNLKHNLSSKINYPLYKIQHYKNNPKHILFLGDSRTDNLIKYSNDSINLHDMSNVAYGGGTLAEIIDTFWYLTKKHNIKKVYIGINFNLFNDNITNNRVTEAISLRESVPSYIFSKYTFRTSRLMLQSLITKDTFALEKPSLSREEFWDHQLNSSAAYYYENYVFPNIYIKRIKEIAKFCIKNGIELQFFIPPTHVDLQNRIVDFGLEEEAIFFKQTLKSLGKTFDFDYPNVLTKKKANFLDPFHFNDSIANIILSELTTNQTKYARLD